MNNDTIEIRISDLIAVLLKAFKPILFATMIFALLGGGFGLFRGLHSGNRAIALNERIQQAEETVQKSAEKFADAQKMLTSRTEEEIPQAEEMIRYSEELVNSRKEYLENSLYNAIDPFRCGVSRLTVRIIAETGREEDAPSIFTSAASRLFSDDSELLADIRRIMKTDAENAYIRELISVSYISDMIAEIIVYHSDAQLAEAASDAIFNCLNQYLGKDGSFSSEIVDRFTGYEINWEIRDSRLMNTGNLVSEEQSLADARETLKRLKTEIPDLEKAVEEANSTLEDDVKSLQKAQKKYNSALVSSNNIIKSSLLYLIVMFFVGLLLSCFICIVLCFARGKLLNRNMILMNFKYPLLGVLPAEKPRLFEKTIRKLEGESDADYQSAEKAVAQTLFSLTSNHNICFVSSLGKDGLETLASLMDKQIPACGDIVNDPDAIKALSSFDSVVLVEKKNISQISMIENVIRQAKALGKEILGIVLT